MLTAFGALSVEVEDVKPGALDSFTLMVTLLGVRSIGCAKVSFEAELVASFKTSRRFCPVPVPESTFVRGDNILSADMLRNVRSPVSSRGRFRVTEESASSMELREGGFGPSDVARLGIRGRPSEGDSITLLLTLADGQRRERADVRQDECRDDLAASRTVRVFSVRCKVN